MVIILLSNVLFFILWTDVLQTGHCFNLVLWSGHTRYLISHKMNFDFSAKPRTLGALTWYNGSSPPSSSWANTFNSFWELMVPWRRMTRWMAVSTSSSFGILCLYGIKIEMNCGYLIVRVKQITIILWWEMPCWYIDWEMPWFYNDGRYPD